MQMPRPLRNFMAACRSLRQAAAIWSWIKAAYASVVAFPTRLLRSISGFVTGLFSPPAAPAVTPPKRKSDVGPKPAAGPLWRRLKRLASISGFRRSKAGDPTSPTAPKSSNGSSSISAARAASQRCSSSSTTTRRQAARPATGSSRRSAGSSPRTSTKGASSDPSRSGRKRNSSRSWRFASSKPCR